MKSRQSPQSSIFPFIFLAVFSAIVAFSYNVLLNRIGIDYAGMRGGGPTWFESAMPGEKFDKRRKLEIDNYINKRIAEITKDTWPECVQMKWTSITCKEYIDQEILAEFTGRDKYIRVIIKGKRTTGDDWYNTVVITMSDYDMAVGTGGDGAITYDFEWESSGQLATPEQEAEIPPILATETLSGTPAVMEQVESTAILPTTDDAAPAPALDPAVALAADPLAVEYEPLIMEDEPVLVEGASIDAALFDDTNTNPIAGGVVVDPSTPNTAEGDLKLDPLIDALLAPTGAPAPADGAPTGVDGVVAPGGEVTVAEAGARTLPTFDCTGLTGHNCCLLIKLTVRDSDVHNNAIQCQLVYEEGSNKNKFWLNSRGKKVFIFASHNDLVHKVPNIVGDWPKGVGNFSSWLEDGGDPNRTDWIPPEGT